MTDDDIDRAVAASHCPPGSWAPCSYCGNRHYLSDLSVTQQDVVTEVLWQLIQYMPVAQRCQTRVAFRYFQRLGRRACATRRGARYADSAALLRAQTRRYRRGAARNC